MMAFLTDMIFSVYHISATASMSSAGEEFLPPWVELGAAVILAVLIIRVFWQTITENYLPKWLPRTHTLENNQLMTCGCEIGCSCVTCVT
jgi:hypothetical protein